MVEINNLTTVSIDKKFLKEVAQKVLEGEGKKEPELSIALIGQGKMRELNKRYRGKNRVTDILAFPESKTLSEKFKVGPLQKIQGLGEIVICLREVKKNAKKFEVTFKSELAKVLIHGVLHLLGYNHEKNESAAEKMEKKENYYFKKIF